MGASGAPARAGWSGLPGGQAPAGCPAWRAPPSCRVVGLAGSMTSGPGPLGPIGQGDIRVRANGGPGPPGPGVACRRPLRSVARQRHRRLPLPLAARCGAPSRPGVVQAACATAASTWAAVECHDPAQFHGATEQNVFAPATMRWSSHTIGTFVCERRGLLLHRLELRGSRAARRSKPSAKSSRTSYAQVRAVAIACGSTERSHPVYGRAANRSVCANPIALMSAAKPQRAAVGFEGHLRKSTKHSAAVARQMGPTGRAPSCGRRCGARERSMRKLSVWTKDFTCSALTCALRGSAAERAREELGTAGAKQVHRRMPDRRRPEQPRVAAALRVQWR